MLHGPFLVVFDRIGSILNGEDKENVFLFRHFDIIVV